MEDKYFLAAEADKIQDLLFRSSRLREIVGGSQLLTAFCEEAVPILAKEFEGQIIISAGGSIRIVFNSLQKAKKFSEYLAELYRRELGGTITIAEPIRMYDSEHDTIKASQEDLVRNKHIGKSYISTEYMPYMAICASCGIGIAEYYEKKFEEDKENYLCDVCAKKAHIRDQLGERFLSKLSNRLTQNKTGNLYFPNEVSQIGALDSRNYVAYIKADVNNMGAIFSHCNTFEMQKNLSIKLEETIYHALAQSTDSLITNQEEHITKEGNCKLIPVLPLIIGGDDIFLLLSAAWSMDFIYRFVKIFTNSFRSMLSEMDIQTKIKPTISAALIICKSTLPYLVANDLGEMLLKEGKQIANRKESSIISFKVITNQDIAADATQDRLFVAGYRGYKIEKLKELIDYRYKLKDMPGRRRNQLQQLYYQAEQITEYEEMVKQWKIKMDQFLRRVEETEYYSTLKEALVVLGDTEEECNWIYDDGHHYHSLPDLLRGWDFAYDIDKNLKCYKEGEG